MSTMPCMMPPQSLATGCNSYRGLVWLCCLFRDGACWLFVCCLVCIRSVKSTAIPDVEIGEKVIVIPSKRVSQQY